MRIVITGADGQIGWELAQAFAHDSHFENDEVISITRAQIDLGNANSIRENVRRLKSDLIINAAGYTAVDRAETEPELAQAINGTAVGILGEEASRIGAAVIHFSTDYVFDGGNKTPYLPNDPPNPISVYGRTKLAGEIALLASDAPAIILRTAWVYGLRRRNFLLAILRQAMRKPELKVVNDQVGCPTWCRAIAVGTLQIVRHSLKRDSSGSLSFGEHAGVHHLAAHGQTTWYEFATQAIAAAPIHPKPRILPILTTDYPTPAKRPMYSVLNCESTKSAFGVVMKDWREEMLKALDDETLSAALVSK